MTKGWSSQNLQEIDICDERYWSVYDATVMLGPRKLSDTQVRNLINLAGLKAEGRRRNGSHCRHVLVYRAIDILNAYRSIMSVNNTFVNNDSGDMYH